MKKRSLLSLLAVGLVGMVLASCGSDPSSSSPSSADSSSENPSSDSSSVSSESSSESSSSESSSSSSSSSVADETAPVLTLASTAVSVAAGESVTLPTATAVDNVDGNISSTIDIQSTTKSGKVTSEGGVYSFSSNVAGEHKVSYWVKDAAGNETEDYVTVTVTPATPENFDVSGFNDIEVLASYATFKENFEQGEKSPLVKGALQSHVALDGTANAIAGNSMVIDYGALVGHDNIVYLTNLGPYLKPGKWTVSFDVKLASGQPSVNDFYFGYNYQGSVSSTDQRIDLSGLAVAGDKVTVNYSQVINFESGKDYWFSFFKLSQTTVNDMVLAFDNFVFTYAYGNTQNYVPTLEELQAGVTYDWNTKSMAIVSSEVIAESDIPDADAKTAIDAATSGFDGYVQHMTGGSSHTLGAFNATNMEPGKIYTIEFDYYLVSLSGGLYVIMMDGTSGNHAISDYSLSASSGMGHFKMQYKMLAGEYAINVYIGGNINMYVGTLTATVSDPAPESPYIDSRSDVYAFTTQDATATNGYTYTWADNNAIVPGANGKYAIIDRLDAAMKAEMTSANGFSSAQALYLKGYSTSNFTTWDGKFVEGYSYTVSFNAYVAQTGAPIVLFLTSAGAGTSTTGTFNVTQVSGNIYHYEATFSPTASDYTFSFYGQGSSSYELYVGDMNIKATEIIVEEGKTPLGFSVGQTWTMEGIYASQFGKSTMVTTPAEYLTGNMKTTSQLFDLNPDTTYELFRCGSMMESGCAYQITVVYNVASIVGSGLYIRMDGNFQPIDGSVGYHEATFNFTGVVDFFSLYNTGGVSDGAVYLSHVVIELTAIA